MNDETMDTTNAPVPTDTAKMNLMPGGGADSTANVVAIEVGTTVSGNSNKEGNNDESAGGDDNVPKDHDSDKADVDEGGAGRIQDQGDDPDGEQVEKQADNSEESQKEEKEEEKEDGTNKVSNGDAIIEAGVSTTGTSTTTMTPPSPAAPTPSDIEFRKIGAEIVFPSDTSQAASIPMPGEEWTNLRWITTNGERKVRFCELCSRVVKVGRTGLMWKDRLEFHTRKLTVYEKPNLILILRTPKDADEIRQHLDLPGGFEVDVKTYLVVETVIDPITCKLRLSPLTTPTSIENSTYASPDARLRGCFELLTPTETILLGSFVPPTQSSAAVQTSKGSGSQSGNDSMVGFLETKSMEVAIGNTLFAAHSPSGDSLRFGVAWKHQLVLGSLSSFVVSGSQRQLEKALSSALQQQHAGVVSNKASKARTTHVHSRVIDQLDESGRTALHYACERRSSAAVTMLIGAGADCTIAVEPGLIYPIHLSAMRLDEKSLSTILSASYPNRPDPNAVDKHGQTAMYIAATKGLALSGETDETALSRCLSALDVWGGMMMSPVMSSGLRHPISLLSAEWNIESLVPVLGHAPHRYPLPLATARGRSVGALYQYPIHSAIVTLRKKIAAIAAVKKDGDGEQEPSQTGSTRVSQVSKPKPKFPDMSEWRQNLCTVVETLLQHGFEPNERLDRPINAFDGADELIQHVGYSPLQILGAAALDTDALAQRKGFDMGVVDKLSSVIGGTAELLISRGGRINLECPPTERPNRTYAESLPTVQGQGQQQSDKKDGTTVDDKQGNDGTTEALVLPEYERSSLRIESNKAIVLVFGGMSRIKSGQKNWSAQGTIKLVRPLPSVDKKSDGNINTPGGNDDRSCAICWKQFGPIMNRKQTCRVTGRYVSDECSTKRVVVDGKEERISDGQYHAARRDKARKLEEQMEEQKEQLQQKKERMNEAKARVQAKEREERESRESLFGGFLDKATNFVMGDDLGDDQLTAEQGVTSLQASLGETRDALNQRGERLNSLAEKTERLAEASNEFAKMAKQLEDSQRGGFFW